MKVLFVTSEARPFAASGGLADVSAALPKALCAAGHNVRVIMPLYGAIPGNLREGMRFLKAISVPVSWRRQYCGIFEAKYDGVITYFLDNEYYFRRAGLYGHYDDAERFAFFARAVLETLIHIDFAPAALHCNDWQTALVPVYRQLFYTAVPKLGGVKTVMTVHNIQYQGVYGKELINDVFGIPSTGEPLVTFNRDINLLKGGLECADRITTVSPTYAREILDPWFSHGLDPILRDRRWKLSGIINGIDTEALNPETDPALYAHYSAEDLSGKEENKEKLLERLGLFQNGEPLIGMVTRLTGHKGLDLVRAKLDAILQKGVRMVVLGSGDWEYQEFFEGKARQYPGRLSFCKGFIPELAQKIYAGADMFLMPSRQEPCGLAQMIALRYGTIPIVRETGGLADTVRDSGDGEGNGFTFAPYSPSDMVHAVFRAVEGYANREGWRVLQKRAMDCDNSWKKSAEEYARLYKSIK
ncbi:MAG: glycogen synthase [Oscillospiraceae bacterium]|jgi:starch synthase|nr:glycogen synthase [Oscillospiraceae bacterium]